MSVCKWVTTQEGLISVEDQDARIVGKKIERKKGGKTWKYKEVRQNRPKY